MWIRQHFHAIMICFVCMISLSFGTSCLSYASESESRTEQNQPITIDKAWIEQDLIWFHVTNQDGVQSELTLKLSDYLKEEDREDQEYISIQAVDLEGNKSDIFKIKNPYYKEQTEESIKEDLFEGISLVDIMENATEEAKQEQEIETSTQETGAVTEPSTLPSGEGVVLEHITNDGKEFYTIESKSGSIFYLVVDHQQNEDEIYFLNTVTEEDLIGLSGEKSYGDGDPIEKKTVEQVTEVQTEPDTTSIVIEETAEHVSEQPEQKESNPNFMSYLLPIAVIVLVGGVGYYFKIVKRKHDHKNEEYDVKNEDDEMEEEEGEDDWDEDDDEES